MAAKISVIMPVYNCERYLEQALQSVLSQSVKELEVIAVDDHSTDGSLDILRKCAEKDTRIRVFCNEKNLGVSAVRNIALEQVTGELVAFCDADDVVPAGAYEALVAAIEGADLAIGTFDDLHYDGDQLMRMEHCLMHPDAGKSDFLAIFSVCCLWTKLFRTSFIRDNALSFDERMSIGEDVIFLAQTATCKPRLSKTQETVYYHCHRTEYQSLTHTYTLKAYEQHIECRRRLLEICQAFPECRDYVYLNFSRDTEQYLHFLNDGADKVKAFELFRAYMRGYNYEQKPLLFKAFVGVDYDTFLQMSAGRFYDHRQKLEARERVAAEFDVGMIGFRWIVRYLKGWLRFKFKHSYQ